MHSRKSPKIIQVKETFRGEFFDNSTVLSEKLKNKEYEIQRDNFCQTYEDLSKDNFRGLKKEFQELVIKTMQLKENQSHLLQRIMPLASIDFYGTAYIFQANEIRCTISKSTFSNEELDSVSISNNDNPNEIEYIVTQDPSQNSMIDFLKMIGEFNVSHIIFLTRSSSHQSPFFNYWASEKQSVTYNGYKLLTDSETTQKNLIKRIITVICQNSDKIRKLTLIQLSTCFQEKEPIFNIYQDFFEYLSSIKGKSSDEPLLYHTSNSNLDQCSMLICISKILSNLEDSYESINIFDTMLELNQYRNLMLQNETQYFCIYEYIYEFLNNQKLLNS